MRKPRSAWSASRDRNGGHSITPFELHYTPSRRERAAVELIPWVPAIAGSIGFGIGALVLASDVSAWLLLLLLVPLILYRGLMVLLIDLMLRSPRPVHIQVAATAFTVRCGNQHQTRLLDGIIQVFRTEGQDSWTVLHLDRSSLVIPVTAITSEQVDFLKSFARRAATERRTVPHP